MDGAGLGPPVGGSAIAVPRETVSFDLVDTKGRPARHGVVDEKSDVDVMEIIGPIKTAARAASRIAVSSNIWSVPDLQVGSRLIVTCPAYPIPLRMADRIVLLPDPLARDLAGFPEELLFRVDQARRRTDARLAKARLSD